MDLQINKKIIGASIERYGRILQASVCMEECGELIQQISKQIRGNGSVSCLTEEIADVYVCLEMLIQMYGVSISEVNKWIEYKQKRQEERLINNE